MSWDYRVLRNANGDHAVIECHYNDNGTVISWHPATPMGRTKRGLGEDLVAMLGALNRPTLDLGDLDGGWLGKRRRRASIR